MTPSGKKYVTRCEKALRSIFPAGFLLIALCSMEAFAQIDQGAIIGVVQDSTGAVIPGAQVILTDTETGLVLTAKSNKAGNYFFSPIKTGNYTVSASASGFETTEEQNIVVHVTDRLNIPLKLRPGKVSETVTITSTAPLMQTQTAEVAMDIDSRFLNDAPLANRNWIFIAQEAPGVTPAVGRGAGNGDFSSDGQHSEQNNYQLDGVDNNTANSDYINGSGYNLAPPPDAISEFKLEANSYSAELGRGHAAVINATTKSGTNQIHGDVWEYVRNTALDAVVWNSPPGSKPANFHLNQFGATLGLPIIKNHLFYFGDVQEARYVNGATPTTYTVPTARMRRGDFSELLNPANQNGSCPTVLFKPNVNTGAYVCNSGKITTPPSGALQQAGTSQVTAAGYTFAPGQNVFATNQIDPVAQKLLQLYPCPNYAASGYPGYQQPNGGFTPGDCNAATDNDTGATANNYQTNLTSTSDPINIDQRLDWNVTSRDLATLRFDYQHTINTFPAPLGPILDGTGSYQGHNQSYKSENVMFSETHTFSPTLINEARFGYNYGNDSNLQYGYNDNTSATYGLGGVPFSVGPQNGGLPATSIGGYTAFGAHANDPAHEGQNSFQILDNVTKLFGNHSLKMGVDLNPIRWYSTNAGTPRGAYTFGSTYTGVTGQGNTGYGGADFLALGTLQGGGYSNTDNMASGALSSYTYTHFVQNYMAAYVQDDWKATQKLTLNVGVRYEYFTPHREQSDQLANFVLLSSQMTPNGATGSGQLVIPISQESNPIPANLQALLTADNVQVVYTQNHYLSNFANLNFGPRFGASYAPDPRTVFRIGGGVFFGGFEPGGGAANDLNPPYVVNANTAALPTCTTNNYCGSQTLFGNTLEGGLGQFMGAGGIANHSAFPTIEEQDPYMHMPYTMNYNLSMQKVFTPTITATVSYVGSLGRHLVTGLNNPDMPQAITIGGQQTNGFTPFPHLSGGQWESWTGASSYNSLQAMVQKRLSHGLSFFSSYTWAHALDNTNDLLGGDYGAYKQSALIPIRYEWGQSGYDIRHRLVINTDYDLPYGVGRQFGNHRGILDELLGGWKTDMEFTGQTGTPFTVSISRISGYGNANGGLSNSAVKIANPYDAGLPAPNVGGSNLLASGITAGTPSNSAGNVCAAKTRTRERWFNPCAFANPIGVSNANNAAAAALLEPYATGHFSYYSPAIGPDSALANGAYNTNGTTNTTFPNGVPYVTGYQNVKPFFGSSKNDVSGPGNWRLNASLFKDFRTFREQYLELRADAFNVLNHPSIGNPGSTSTNIGGAGAVITGPGFNQTNTIDARFFQLSGKYVF